MKKFCISILLVLFVSSLVFADEWINFSDIEGTVPFYTVLQSDNSCVSFEVNIPGIYSRYVDEYDRVNIPEHTRMDSVGNPEVPIVSFLVAIPECDSIELNVTVLDSTIIDSINIYPAPELVVDTTEGYTYIKEQFAINEDTYSTDAYLPGYSGELVQRGAIRAQHCIRVVIYPVQFNPVQQDIIAFSKINITLTFENPSGSINEDVGIFNEVCGNSMINYESNGLNASISCGAGADNPGDVTWLDTLSQLFDPINPVNCDYLIIVPHDPANNIENFWLNSDIEALADKRANYNGFDIVIVNTDDIHNDANIQGDYLYQEIWYLINETYQAANANNTYDDRLAYVNLFGDVKDGESGTDLIPITPGYYDVYYSQLNDPETGEWDDYPDLMLGRCSADNDTTEINEIKNICQKIINYEPIPSTAGWRDSITFLVGQPNSNEPPLVFYSAIGTGLVYIENYVVNYGNTLIKRNDFPYSPPSDWTILTYNNPDERMGMLLDKYEDGNLIFNYMGHGGPFSFSGFSYDSLAAAPSRFRNRLPLIFSMSCLTGAFHNRDDCMAEEFLNQSDTLGAIGFVGAADITTGDAMGVLNPLLFESMHENYCYTLGEILFYAKINLPYSVFRKLFNLFGDPALNIKWDESCLEYGDLVLRNEWISFDEYPHYSNECEISSNIMNISINDITDDILVKFYLDEILESNLIDTTVIQDGIMANQTDSVSISWVPGDQNTGNHKIWIVVNPEGPDRIPEITYINNKNKSDNILVNAELPGFPIQYNSGSGAEYIVCYDFLNNDYLEILYGQNLYNQEGDTLWEDNLENIKEAVVGDLNNDNQNEIYASISDTFRSIDPSNGYYNESFGTAEDFEFLAGLATDKIFLYICGTLRNSDPVEYRLCKYDYNGAYIADPRAPIFSLSYFKSSERDVITDMVIGDLDRDDVNDILIIYRRNLSDTCIAIDGAQGDTLFIFSRGNLLDKLVLCDLDNDGVLEIITSQRNENNDCRIIIIDNTGSIKDSSDYDYAVINSLIVSDIECDGTPEIIFSDFSDDNGIYCLDLHCDLKYQKDSPYLLARLVSGDINGDNDQDIVVGTGTGSALVMVIDFVDSESYELEFPNYLIWYPVLCDLDNDNDIDFICAGNSYIHTFDFLDQSNWVEWGQYKCDAQNTGCYSQRYNLTDIVYDFDFSKWRWMSFPVLINYNSANVDSFLEPIIEAEAIKQIKWEDEYYSWEDSTGTLDTVKSIRGYKIEMYDSYGNYPFNGIRIDASEPIPLDSTDWNWVGYLPDSTYSIEDALVSIEDNVYQAKSQNKSSTYYSEYGWIGDLTNMVPEEGYLINMNDPDTLIYPDSLMSKSNPRNVICRNTRNWQVMENNEYNMVLLAEIDPDTLNIKSKNISIGAFDDEGICRSIGITQNLNKDTELWYFTIVGNEEDLETVDIHFELYYEGKGDYYKSNEKLKFDKDITIGSPKELFKITLSTLPIIYKLEQNYPNPFSPKTTIKYAIPKYSKVELKIYNIKGQLVKTLVSGKKEAGYYYITWDGKNDKGKQISNGVYLYKLKAGKKSFIKKMILMR